jgi:protein SOK2
MHLKGVWIPYERALDFANKEKIIDLLYPLFVTDIKAVLYHPANFARTAQVLSAAEKRKAESAAQSADGRAPGGALPAPGAGAGGSQQAAQQQQYYYYGQNATGAPAGQDYNGLSRGQTPDQKAQQGATAQAAQPGSTGTSGHQQGPLHQSGPGAQQQQQQQQPQPGSAGSGSGVHTLPQPQQQPQAGGYRYTYPSLPHLHQYQQLPPTGQSGVPPPLHAPVASGPGGPGQADYAASSTPMTDSLPHTPASLHHPHQGQRQTGASDGHDEQGKSMPGLSIMNHVDGGSTTSPRLYQDQPKKE